MLTYFFIDTTTEETEKVKDSTLDDVLTDSYP